MTLSHRMGLYCVAAAPKPSAGHVLTGSFRILDLLVAARDWDSHLRRHYPHQFFLCRPDLSGTLNDQPSPTETIE